MAKETTSYGVVLVTTSSEAEGEKLATALVTGKLAACVSLVPVRSVYIWEGELCKEQEWQLVIKTHLSNFEQLAVKVKELHSYEVPEIIALPIAMGSQHYLDWIERNTVNT